MTDQEFDPDDLRVKMLGMPIRTAFKVTCLLDDVYAMCENIIDAAKEPIFNLSELVRDAKKIVARIEGKK